MDLAGFEGVCVYFRERFSLWTLSLIKVSHRGCCRFARSSKETGEARSGQKQPPTLREVGLQPVSRDLNQPCGPKPAEIWSSRYSRREVDLGSPSRALDVDRGGGAGGE